MRSFSFGFQPGITTVWELPSTRVRSDRSTGGQSGGSSGWTRGIRARERSGAGRKRVRSDPPDSPDPDERDSEQGASPRAGGGAPDSRTEPGNFGRGFSPPLRGARQRQETPSEVTWHRTGLRSHWFSDGVRRRNPSSSSGCVAASGRLAPRTMRPKPWRARNWSSATSSRCSRSARASRPSSSAR